MMRVAISDRLAVALFVVMSRAKEIDEKKSIFMYVLGKRHTALSMFEHKRIPHRRPLLQLLKDYRIKSNLLPKSMRTASRRYGYVRIRRYLFSWHESELAPAKQVEKPKSQGRKAIIQANKERFGFGFGFQLTGHNLVEATEIDGVGQSRRHGLLATVHRHLGKEAGFRSHDWLGC